MNNKYNFKKEEISYKNIFLSSVPPALNAKNKAKLFLLSISGTLLDHSMTFFYIIMKYHYVILYSANLYHGKPWHASFIN